MQDTQSMSRQHQLETLFVNNAKFDSIGHYLGRFNPIRVMQMERMEIRHTAILAWLLDPHESHGLGDHFLKAFLGEAFRGTEKRPSAIEISNCDLRDAEILREKRNMDLFISAPRNGWAIVIENKLGSKQHGDQLKRYIKRAKRDAEAQKQDFTLRGIFLTLEEEEIGAGDKADYTSLRYHHVCDILQGLMENFTEEISPKARQFIEDYQEVIEDLCGMNRTTDNMKELAKELYRSHRAALDFIMEHGCVTGFSTACDEVFGADREKGALVGKNLLYTSSSPTRFLYIPAAWKDLLDAPERSALNQGCSDWNSGYGLGCWFDLRKNADGIAGKLFLNFEVGPISDPELRGRLIDPLAGIDDNVSFTAKAKKPNTKYSRFLKNNSRKIDDIGDSDHIKEQIGELLEKFEPTVGAVSDVLRAFTPAQRQS